ncbi:hypothetical protein RCC89_04520 [Cytophagaceae bacterium ABcell3]|nr:hypothetical protein RCC89_04520 [Cytophagaceae bacterium ABcell3]
MSKTLFKTPTILLSCISAFLFLLTACKETDINNKDNDQDALKLLVHEAIDECVKELPEVMLIDRSMRLVPAKDSTDHEKIICEVFLAKRDPANHSFTDYTDKLIKLRVMSKVKERLYQEEITIPTYYHIMFLSRN